MSFLSGLLSVGKSAVGLLSGNTFTSALVRTAILGFAVKKLSNNAIKDNNSGTQNIDSGVRLQIAPNAESKIPVLYGSAFFGGNISDAAMTNNNKTMWYCLVLSEKTGTVYSTNTATNYTFNNIYWNDQRVIFNSDGITANYTVDRSGNIDRSISGLVKIYCYKGGYNQGVLPSGYTGTVPTATSVFPNWTTGTHAMENLIFALVRVDYNRERNVTGIADMLFNITSTMKSPGDVVYDYLTNTTYGAGISSSEISTDDITALNTYSAENLSYDDQGTGAETLADRYQINGLIDTKNPVLRNAESILSAAASWLSYDTHQGLWGVVINKAETSSASFDDSNILGSISLSGTGLQDLYNEVKVEFPHRELRDSADFVNIAIASEDRNANEEDNTLNITYDIINEPIQAQLLGFIELKQSRVDKIIQFQTDFGKYNLKAGDVIDVTNARFDFTDKLFRIISINEIQDNGGALIMEITALEYDSNVYSTDDLYRFTRSDANGIITIGSIGVPATPQVTKIEVDARPRVVIETTSPTGVVEGIEYWLTTDVGTSTDSLRSYILIATKRPTGGGVYTSGTIVELDYDQLNESNFYIKTRGFNTTTVGPFSDPSGLVEFAPTQVTNAIGPDTQTIDPTTGLITALAVNALLNQLGNLLGSDGAKEIFDAIFEEFEDVTGIDLVGQASEGELVVASDLEIKADNTSLGPNTASIDFIGPLLAEGDSDITVKIKPGSANKDILAWNAAESEWQLISGCISCDFTTPPEPPTPATPCSLQVGTTLPAAKSGWSGACEAISSVPYRGSYFVKFTIDPGTVEGGAARPAIPLYAPLQLGSGKVYLYGSDGSVEQSLSTSQVIVHNDVLELPFKPRQPGKDYYILLDSGFISSCSCNSVAITQPTWDFTTSLIDLQPYSVPTPSNLASPPAGSTYSKQLRLVSYNPVGSNRCVSGNTLSLTFSEAIKKGSGTVSIKERLSGNVVVSYNISSATVTGSTASWSSPIIGLSANTQYDVDVPAGLVLTTRPGSTTALCDITVTTPAGPEESSSAGSFGFATTTNLELVNFELCREASGQATLNSNIVLTFNKTIGIKATSPANVYIYESGGGLHQKIDLKATFASAKVNELNQSGGTTLSINPTKPFKGGATYYLNIDNGVVLDTGCNLGWSGISDADTVRWTTDGIEVREPSGPSFGSVYLRFEFGRPVLEGQGKINIISTSGELISQIGVNHPAIKFSETPFTA
jgi:hypothetical protein